METLLKKSLIKKKYNINFMSETIDVMNSKIRTRFLLMRSVLAFLFEVLERELEEQSKQYFCSSFLKGFAIRLKSCERDYTFRTVDLLLEYYKSEKSDDNKIILYLQLLNACNILGRMTILQNSITFMLKDFCLNQTIFEEHELKKAMYHAGKIIVNIENCDLLVCDPLRLKKSGNVCASCLSDKIREDNGERWCNDCGRRYHCPQIDYCNFNNHEYYSGSKSTKYDPTKHCKFWVSRIQATESKHIPKPLLTQIYNCLVRDNIKKKEHITCALMRRYLREIKKTNYNEHISLIRKLITDCPPPTFTLAEQNIIFSKFKEIMVVFNDIKPKNKINCPYHPYFIFKIIEQYIKDPVKRKDLLRCIHLQSRSTLIENDKLWKQICEKIPDLKYRPTKHYI